MFAFRIFATAAFAAVAVLALAPHDAHAQQLPTPRAMASGLDVECYRTPGPPLNTELTLSHLNPVLQELGLPAQKVKVTDLAFTCVPVRKNGVFPPQPALSYIMHVDFACYNVEADPLPNPVPLGLTHLNPQFVNLPQHGVTLERMRHLCLPVGKNGNPPPAAIRALVQFIDLACFETDPGPHPMFGANLWQLNPQLAGIAPHPMTLVPNPRELCVPVRKNQQFIPEQFLRIIEWLDLERFMANPIITIAPVAITLQHLNPLFVNRPSIPVTLQFANSLMVPVAKNGELPPND